MKGNGQRRDAAEAGLDSELIAGVSRQLRQAMLNAIVGVGGGRY